MRASDQQERRQRVRIGLTGLAFVFLLVLLGTAISRSGDSGPVDEALNRLVPEEPEEPLAQIGAAPGTAAANDSAASPAAEPTKN